MARKPEQINNSSGFASSNNKYHTLSTQESKYGGTSATQPDISIRIRNARSRPTKSTKYFFYSIPGVSSALDLNKESSDNVSVFPRNIYDKSPLAYSPSLLIIPRDKEYLYTYSPDPSDNKERSKHTITPSRYGYDRFYNEYGLGTQTRGYIEPAECNACASDTPADMAPKRFYTAYHLQNTPTEARKGSF